MRENMGIYRGKRKDTGEWVEGFYYANPALERRLYGERHWITSDENGLSYEVDPATVGQYAGLPDKKGKRIFEGDIVRERFHGPASVVEFCLEDVASCGCCIPSFVGSGFKAKGCNLNICEVIGNIYDNPELLEVTPDE